MKYEYKKLTPKDYVDSLYKDGFSKSKKYTLEEIEKLLELIGMFKFKGYVKAFRRNVSKYNIDDIIYLYETDRNIAVKMFKLSSMVEIKLKAFLIDTVYEITENPFCYLIKSNHYNEFELTWESVRDWEIKNTNANQMEEIYKHYRDYYIGRYSFNENLNEYLNNCELISLSNERDINYPPFHYLIENMTFGATIKMLFSLKVNNQSILKLVAQKFNFYNFNVFKTYLLRLQELRNRCAHNGRIFNRNYRGVKAFGEHRYFRNHSNESYMYEHKLLDVYYSVHYLLSNRKYNDIETLVKDFGSEILENTDENTKDFILEVIMKQGKCACRDLP